MSLSSDELHYDLVSWKWSGAVTLVNWNAAVVPCGGGEGTGCGGGCVAKSRVR